MTATTDETANRSAPSAGHGTGVTIVRGRPDDVEVAALVEALQVLAARRSHGRPTSGDAATASGARDGRGAARRGGGAGAPWLPRAVRFRPGGAWSPSSPVWPDC